MPSIDVSFPRYIMGLTARIRIEGVDAGTIEAPSDIPAILDWRSVQLFGAFKTSSACWMETQLLECHKQLDEFEIERLQDAQENGNAPGLFAGELIRGNIPNFSRAVNTPVVHRAALR